PNPTRGNFLIEIPETQHENYIIRIHSLTGVLLLEKQAELSTVTRLDISSYQSGLYMVTIEGEHGVVYATKIMKL
ncbi:MAG: T9SS type A sorting domain-containing protein, partial [Bacteroidetes bacterium]|nr:T9SS type A sorting domain-containing protein [Bacteroidota bacterium]